MTKDEWMKSLNWIPVNQKYCEYPEDDAAPPIGFADTHDELVSGTVLHVRKTDGTEAYLVVGDINEYRGTCGCCSDLFDEDMILAYAKLWSSQ